MDKRAHRPARATLALAWMDTRWLLVHRVLPALIALLGLDAVASFVVPPLVRNDRLALRESQLAMGFTVLPLLAALCWMLPRQRDAQRVQTHRLINAPRVVLADTLGLALTLGLASLAWGSIALYRISVASAAAAAVSTLFTILPLAFLAPGMVRLPLGLVAFTTSLAVCVAGLLGFFGRRFPLRADTVFDLGEATQSWSADGFACLACLCVSLGIARARKPSPTCG